jgi:diacylglycerol kinase family enzyme
MKRSAGKAAVLFNARAGRGRGARTAARVVRFMEGGGWQISGCLSTPPHADDRTNLMAEWAQRVDRLVVVGGDGTLREVSAAIHAQDLKTTVGFVPIGNANVVARELGIPRDPRGAIRILTTDCTLAVDIACISPGDRAGGPMFFLAMLEIGFGAAVIHRVHRWRTAGWRRLYRFKGDLLYVPAALQALRALPFTAFQIKLDDQPVLADCRLAVVANTRTYAKGWSLTPGASPVDGRLDVFSRRRSDPAAVIRNYAGALRRRTIPGLDVRYRCGRRLAISSPKPLCLQADGEPLPPLKRLDIAVRPGAVRILVPEAAQRARFGPPT